MMSIAEVLRSIIETEAGRMGSMSSARLRSLIPAVNDLEFRQERKWQLEERMLGLRKVISVEKAKGALHVPIATLEHFTGGAFQA